jgi:penicillin-binding protein 1A
MVVGLYVGFDQPETLGGRETGGSTSVPIFEKFMAEALKDKPATPFRVPPGIRLVRVNPSNGHPADPSDRKAIWEAFLPGTEPGGEHNDGAILAGGGGDVLPGGDFGGALNPDSDPGLIGGGDSYSGSTGLPRSSGGGESSGTGGLY